MDNSCNVEAQEPGTIVEGYVIEGTLKDKDRYVDEHLSKDVEHGVRKITFGRKTEKVKYQCKQKVGIPTSTCRQLILWYGDITCSIYIVTASLVCSFAYIHVYIVSFLS